MASPTVVQRSLLICSSLLLPGSLIFCLRITTASERQVASAPWAKPCCGSRWALRMLVSLSLSCSCSSLNGASTCRELSNIPTDYFPCKPAFSHSLYSRLYYHHLSYTHWSVATFLLLSEPAQFLEAFLVGSSLNRIFHHRRSRTLTLARRTTSHSRTTKCWKSSLVHSTCRLADTTAEA
jgi:hypothetical protein